MLAALRTPTPERVFQIKRALQLGASVEAIAERTRIDPWFLHQLAELVEAEAEWQAAGDAAQAGGAGEPRSGDDERRLRCGR